MATAREHDRDAGFSLVEVVIAIFVISILATAGLSFFLNGSRLALSEQRRELAITVANDVMEDVRGESFSQGPAAGAAGLYAGRSQSATLAVWARNSTAGGVDETYPLWDTAATAGSTPTVPITRTVALSGTEFTVESLYGSCYQPLAGGDCVRLPGQNSPPATTPAGYSSLTRIVVVVSWTAGEGCETAGACTYAASTLFDSTLDLTWLSDE